MINKRNDYFLGRLGRKNYTKEKYDQEKIRILDESDIEGHMMKKREIQEKLAKLRRVQDIDAGITQKDDDRTFSLTSFLFGES